MLDDVALTHVNACVAYEANYDRDVEFDSTFSLDFLMSIDGTIPLQWMLNTNATFHVTLSHEWFNMYSNGMLGHVHLADGSMFDIVGVEDVTLPLPSGASLILRHVVGLDA